MARILVIDDNDLMREMLREMLEEGGHDVVEAADGREGAELCRREPADVVITDILMPEADGLEVIRQLRGSFPDIKLVAISGGQTTGKVDYLTFAQELGAARTFRKPFHPHELLAAIEELLAEE